MSIEAILQEPTSTSVATPFGRCLEPLLTFLGWRGMPRQLAEATVFGPVLDLVDFRNTMERLGFSSYVKPGRLKDVDPRLFPCVFESKDRVLVVTALGSAAGSLACFDGRTAAFVDETELFVSGTLCFFQQIEPDVPGGGKGWIGNVLHRFEHQFFILLAITCLLNITGLVPAFFVQAVYDKVLPSRGLDTLAFLVLGVVLAMLFDLLLRLVRAQLVSHLAGRLDYLLGSSLIEKLLNLPLVDLERANVGSRIAQLREFESIRNVFSGPIFLSVFEAPFVLISVAALAWIGGWLAIIPVLSAFMIATCGFVLVRYAKLRLDRATVMTSDAQLLASEILSNFSLIKASGAEQIWRERFRERSADLAFSNLRAARVAALTDTIGYGTNLIAGTATLAVGAIFAMDGTLSVGVLIASMSLVWRVLSPLQTLFVASTKVEQIRRSIARADIVMAAPIERQRDFRSSTHSRRFAGKVTLDRVVFRYDQTGELSLGGVSLDIKPGEVVAISGGVGSGKSALLKIIAGLYKAQSGSVSLDGVDTRQLSVDDLRASVVYLPQRADLFPGSIRENLTLGASAAGSRQIEDVLTSVGLHDELQRLPRGLDTPVSPKLSVSLINKIVLARTLLVEASVLLLDEPSPIDDEFGEDLLLEQLEMLRGRTTVIFATRHTDHLRAADRVIALRNGMIIHDGPIGHTVQ